MFNCLHRDPNTFLDFHWGLSMKVRKSLHIDSDRVLVHYEDNEDEGSTLDK